MGRPGVKAKKVADPRVRQLLVEGIRRGLTWKMAAQLAGVHECSIHEWRRIGKTSTSGPEFELVQELEAAEAECAVAALARIEAAAEAGNWTASAWLLERRYGYVARQEISGPEGGPIMLAPAQQHVRAALENGEARALLIEAQKRLTGGET